MFESKVCPSCNKPVREEAVFCLDCGERIDNEEVEVEIDDQKSGSVGEIKAVRLENPSLIDNMISDDLLAFDNIEETKPCLKVIEGDDKGVEIPLGERLVLGRKASGDCWRLSDPYISREHAVIRREDDEYLLKNLSGTNGTKVNGVEIDEQKLSHGDLVEIGFTVMSFQKNDD